MNARDIGRIAALIDRHLEPLSAAVRANLAVDPHAYHSILGQVWDRSARHELIGAAIAEAEATPWEDGAYFHHGWDVVALDR
jgi:hypothetical protein